MKKNKVFHEYYYLVVHKVDEAVWLHVELSAPRIEAVGA